MKKGFYLLFVFLLFPSPALCRTMYVGERVEANVRRGNGTDYRIVTLARVGDRVEALEQQGGWTRVRLAGGTTGWMLSRYLTQKEPSGKALARLEKEHAALAERAGSLVEQGARLEDENHRLADGLRDALARAQAFEVSYTTLRAESSELFAVKKALKQALIDRDRQAQTAEKAQEQLKTLERGTGVRWFLAGAGVLLFGLVLGHLIRPRKPRSSLLR